MTRTRAEVSDSSSSNLSSRSRVAGSVSFTSRFLKSLMFCLRTNSSYGSGTARSFHGGGKLLLYAPSSRRRHKECGACGKRDMRINWLHALRMHSKQPIVLGFLSVAAARAVGVGVLIPCGHRSLANLLETIVLDLLALGPRIGFLHKRDHC